jgi:hypothetical protein
MKWLPEKLLTYSMQQSPSSEANRLLASQENSHILWNPKVHKRIRKCPPPVPLLSQFVPVHTTTSYFLKIHLKRLCPPPNSTKYLSFSQYTIDLTLTCTCGGNWMRKYITNEPRAALYNVSILYNLRDWTMESKRAKSKINFILVRN